MLIVKKLRLKRGWSQSELAEFSGLSVRTIQRIEKGANPGLDSLKCLAAVFDMDAADFQREETMDNNGVSKEEEMAFAQVQNEKAFYGHLISYGSVMALLFTINLITGPEYIWAKWPAMGWGLGLFIHGFRVFSKFRIFGAEWEKRQVEKRLGRKL